MKILLTSYRIPNPEKLYQLLDKPPEQAVGAIITNAKERRTPEEKAEKLTSLQNDLAGIGLTNTIAIDLREDDVPFEDVDYVFAAGGNTFELNQAIVDTQFGEKLRTYLNNGGIYVGESAGAIVAGPSLKGFERLDNYFDGAPFEGMGIVKEIIVPHNDSDDPNFKNRAPQIQETNPDYKVVPLNDDEDFIINE